MLAEKYMLLLETLRKGLPDRDATHTDGAPRVISNSPHIPIGLPEEPPLHENLRVTNQAKGERRGSPPRPTAS
jgi:hypothetical protein